MVRFALFLAAGGSILTAAGFFPTPSSEEFPDFLKRQANQQVAAPVQPAIPSRSLDFVFEDATSVEPVVIKRPVPRPASILAHDEADDGPILTLERLVATAGEVVQTVVEQRVSTEETIPQQAELVASMVNFEHDEAALDPFAQSKLNAMIMWLTDNPEQLVAIFGHTDLTGSETYNDGLGMARAEMVADYLTDNGIAADRISSIMSYGETAPLVQTEEKSRANRRVLIQTLQSL